MTSPAPHPLRQYSLPKRYDGGDDDDDVASPSPSAQASNNDDHWKSRPTSPPPRTIDEYLQDAFDYSAPKARPSEEGAGDGSAASGACCAANWRRFLVTQRRYWLLIGLSMGVANSSDATEILCLSYILSDATFETQMLHDDLAFRGGALAGAVFLGMLLGGLVCGDVGDSYGRRPTLLFGLCTNAVAGLLSAAAPDVYSLATLRFVAGVGIGATVPPLFALAAELSPPSVRGRVVTLVASFWFVGSVFVATVAILCFEVWGTSWRIFAATCALPSAVAAILVTWNVPESPRFLAMAGRHREAADEANRVASSMMKGGGGEGDGAVLRPRPTPLRAEEVASSFRGVSTMTHSTASSSSTTTTTESCSAHVRQMQASMASLYTPSAGLRRTTILLQICWFNLSFGSYGLITWINTIFAEIHLRNPYFNALLFAMANLPGNVLAAVALDRVRRNVVLGGSMIASALSLIAFAVCTVDSRRYSLGIVLSACAFQAFSICGWNAIDTITGESFPTHCRGTGLGVCAASGRVGALVAQLVNGPMSSNPAVLVLVAGAVLMVGGFAPCGGVGGGDMTHRPLRDDVGKEHLSDTEEEEEGRDGGGDGRGTAFFAGGVPTLDGGGGGGGCGDSAPYQMLRTSPGEGSYVV